MGYLMIPMVVIYALMGSCRQTWNTPERLARKYSNAPEAYEALRVMIHEDAGKRNQFVVGLDNIGDYWKIGGEWTRTRDFKKKLTLAEVLADVNISLARYEKYRELFSKAGAERICVYGSSGEITSILIFRSGMSFAGCSATVDWNPTPPLPEGKRGEGEFTEVTPLGKNWYLIYECN